MLHNMTTGPIKAPQRKQRLHIQANSPNESNFEWLHFRERAHLLKIPIEHSVMKVLRSFNFPLNSMMSHRKNISKEKM
jgi:ribosomal protein S10